MNSEKQNKNNAETETLYRPAYSLAWLEAVPILLITAVVDELFS